MEPATKDELLNQAARDYKAFHETLTGLNEAQMSEVWLGTWSVKDIVAHISGWHREMGPALERLARGEKPVPTGVSYDDVDAWNAKFAAAKKGAPGAAATADAREAEEGNGAGGLSTSWGRRRRRRARRPRPVRPA